MISVSATIYVFLCLLILMPMRIPSLRTSFSTTAALLLTNGVHAFSKSSCSTTTSCWLSRRPMATSSQEEVTSSPETLRVLILHGSGGTADGFTDTMEIWRTALTESNSIDLELTAIQAPAPKGDGYAWWSMPDGVRSFTAERYDGFEESASAVLKAMQECDFDLVVGHSQGAILTTALLALNKIPRHPPRGYILNGVAWPNPYTKELESLQLQESVLMIVGATDEMNPPKQAMRVKSALQQAGCLVTVVNHSGGHSVPVDMNETLETILQWIVGKG